MGTATKWFGDRLAELVRLRRGGLTYHQVAARMGEPVGAIRAVCKYRRIGYVKPWKRIRRAVRRLLAQELSDSEIARRLDCAQETVARARESLRLPRTTRSVINRRLRAAQVAAWVVPGWGVTSVAQSRMLQAVYELGGAATVPAAASQLRWNTIYAYRIAGTLTAAGRLVVVGKTKNRRRPVTVLGIAADLLRYRDALAGRRPPPEPCPHRPGSEGKIACLEARVERNYTLWHPDDADADVSPDLVRFLLGHQGDCNGHAPAEGVGAEGAGDGD